MSSLARLRTLLILLLPVSVAAGLCLLIPQRRTGIWLDEAYSLLLSRGEGYAHRNLPTGQLLPSLPDLTLLKGAPAAWHTWAGQSSDAHPPLYFLLLRSWRDAFGGSWPAARAYSTGCHLAAVLLITLAGRLISRVWRVSMAAGLTLALGYNGTWYAREIRDYAQLEFACAAVIAAHVYLLRTPNRVWLAASLWSLAALCAGLTHYFSIGVIGGSVLAALLALPSDRKRALLLTAVAGLAVYAVTWLPFLLRQRAAAEGFSGWITHFSWVGLPMRFQSLLGTPGGSLGIPAAGAIPLGAALLTLYAWRLRTPSEHRPLWALAAAVTFGPAFVLALSDLLLGAVLSWQPRYVLPMAPGLALTAGLLATLPTRFSWSAAVLVLLSLLTQCDSRNLETDYPAVVAQAEVVQPHPSATVFIVPRSDDPADAETNVQTLALQYAAHAGPLTKPVLLLDAAPTPELLAALPDDLLIITAWRDPGPTVFLPGYRPRRPAALFPTMGLRIYWLTRSP